MARIIDSGIQGFTLSEYLALMRDSLTATFGENIDTSDESPQIQLLSIVALALAQSDEALVAIHNAFGINTAIGVHLDNLAQLIGISRNGEVRTTFVQNLRGTANTTMYAGALAATADGNVFELVNNVTVGSTGTVAATWRALFGGPVAADPLTRIVTTVSGISGLVPPSDTALSSITIGRLRETDLEFRVRLRQTLARNRRGQTDAVQAAFAEIEGVRDIRLETNNTNAAVTKSNVSIPANSVAVFWRKNDGATVKATDVTAALDKSVALGVARSATEAEARRVNVTFEITAQDSFPHDGDGQIKNAIVAHIKNLRIGESLQSNELYGPIYSVPGHTVSSTGITVQWNAGSATADPDVALPANIDLNLYLSLAFDDISITRPGA